MSTIKIITGRAEDIAKEAALKKNPLPNNLRDVIEIKQNSTVKTVSFNLSSAARKSVKK